MDAVTFCFACSMSSLVYSSELRGFYFGFWRSCSCNTAILIPAALYNPWSSFITSRCLGFCFKWFGGGGQASSILSIAPWDRELLSAPVPVWGAVAEKGLCRPHMTCRLRRNIDAFLAQGTTSLGLLTKQPHSPPLAGILRILVL